MPRRKSPEIALRNEVIYAKWKGGRSLASLAEEYRRTPQVLGRIVAGYHPDLEEDTDRALHRGRLESLYEEVQGVVEAPGWKLAPNGRLACDDDGTPLVDVGAKIEALKLKLMVLESTRKLDARDKPTRTLVTHDIARQQADTALAAVREKIAADHRELAELRKAAARGQVVPGEVLAELPPGAA